MMMRGDQPTTTINSLSALRALVLSLAVLGLAGLILTATLAFEEPNATLLLLSTCLLIAPVAAVFIHLYATQALTPEQRRAWFRQLTGRRALWAFGEYLNASDPAAAAAAFAAKGSRARPDL